MLRSSLILILLSPFLVQAQWIDISSNTSAEALAGPQVRMLQNQQGKLHISNGFADSLGYRKILAYGSAWNTAYTIDPHMDATFWFNPNDELITGALTKYDTSCANMPVESNVVTITQNSVDTIGTSSRLNANNPIALVMYQANGDLLCTGSFTNGYYGLDTTWGQPCIYGLWGESYVARFKNNVWDTLRDAQAPTNYTSNITSWTQDNLGNIYAATRNYDSTGQRIITKWDGVKWSRIPAPQTGAGGFVTDMLCDKQNNLYMVGTFWQTPFIYNVWKYDGAVWTIVGAANNASLNANREIAYIEIDSKGNIYVAGNFTAPSGKTYVAKWDGTSWSNFGNLDGNGDISELLIDKWDNVYASGWFKNNNGKYYIAKYEVTPASVATQKEQQSFTVFPSPATNYIIVSGADAHTRLQLTTIDGRVVSTVSEPHSSNEMKICFNGLCSGMYLVQDLNNPSKVAKVIVQQ